MLCLRCSCETSLLHVGYLLSCPHGSCGYSLFHHMAAACSSWRFVLYVAVVAGVLARTCQAEEPNTPTYYCIENYIPLGQLIQEIPQNQSSNAFNSTSGEIARSCSTACNAEPSCTAFRAVGTESVWTGATCELLANTTGSLSQDLQLPPGAKWPPVLSNLTHAESVQLRSVAWLCMKTAEVWDAFGTATHSLIHTGQAVPEQGVDDQSKWCAFGSDVAGTNLQQYTNLQYPVECDALCGNTSGCTIWTYAAAVPASGQAPYNCFVKADPFRGQNGWTGPPKSDIWIPDSQVDCLLNQGDWRQLGLILSPAVKTIQVNTTYFTVYPERVTWSEANATCSKLPDGRLAVLNTRIELDTTYRELLTTLPIQTAVASAWVGALGTNAQYNPTAPNLTGLAAQPGGISQAQLAQINAQLPAVRANNTADKSGSTTEQSLTWLDGTRVAQDQLRRLLGLPSVWTVHDIVWSQQFVPESVKTVCGRLIIQTPSTNMQGPTDPAELNSAFLPGVWYFACERPAAFICESSKPPLDTMTGRTILGQARVDTAVSSGGTAAWKVALATALPALFVIFVFWQLSRMYTRKSRLPALIWQQRKRALGPPKSGRMSIVVTDIQGYTQLTNEAPDDMAQALLLHNQVIKHAVYDQVGYVIEQEGDSFTISFYEPEDAVAFTLQVQQALLQQVWPASIQYHDAWDFPPLPASTESGSPMQPHSLVHAPGLGLRPSLEKGLDWLCSLAPTSPTGPPPQVGSAHNSFTTPATGPAVPLDNSPIHPLPRDWLLKVLQSPSKRIRSSTSSQLSVTNGAQPVAEATEPPGRVNSQAPSTTSDSVSGVLAWQQNINPRFWQQQSRGQSTSGLSCSAPAAGSGPSTVHTAHTPSLLPLFHGRKKHGSWLQQQLLVPQWQQPQLFHGLRVRMGVATGVVAKGQEVKRSALYRIAQDVSTAANGGQVLMDEPTFIAVKECMRRLGLVTAEGLDYDLLYSSSRLSAGSRAGSGRLFGMGGGSSTASGPSRKRNSLFAGCMSSDRSVDMKQGSRTLDTQQHAVALDMGSYEILQASGTATAAHPTSSTCILWTGEMGGKLVQQYQQYLQRQLHAGPDRYDSSSNHEFAHVHGQVEDVEQPESVFGGYSDAAYGTPSFPGDGRHGQHNRQYSSRSSSIRQLSGQDVSLRTQLRAMQREQLADQGSAGRIQWVEKPRSWWQHLMHSWLGLGVAEQDSADSPLDALSWQSSTAAGAPSSNRATSSSSWGSTPLHLRPPTIRLYQIVSPSLVGRAALFGCKLSLPSTWRCLDAPYFAAPGLNVTESSNTSSSSAAEPVRASLDGLALLGGRSDSDLSAAAAAAVPSFPANDAEHSMPFSSSSLLHSPQQLRSKSKGNLPVVRSGQSLATMVQQDPAGWGAEGADGAAIGAANFISQDPSRSSSFTNSSIAEDKPGMQLAPAHTVIESAVQGKEGHASLDAAAAAPGLALAAAGLTADTEGSRAAQPLAFLSSASPFAAASTNASQAAETDGVAAMNGLHPAGAAAAVGQVTTQDQSQLQHPTSTLLAANTCDSAAVPAHFAVTASSSQNQASSSQNQASSSQDHSQLRALTAHGTAAHAPAVTDIARAVSEGSGVTGAGVQFHQGAADGRVPSDVISPHEAAAHAAIGSSPGRQRSTLMPASSIASSMAMLSLTGGAAVPLAIRGASYDDRAVPKAVSLKFPTICIVFAAVEGVSQLAKYPALAREVHVSVHRLMLQLLQKFPGSYLVRAQAGEAKYLAAFTTPSAAAAWCLTVQVGQVCASPSNVVSKHAEMLKYGSIVRTRKHHEAALYLPYPNELLRLSSFGVQLDATGRLVFRGPRFKMGLNEGSPTCILPDHLGRADYHGAFVNQAARYADAAAHGGQVVTDATLASKVVEQWHSDPANSGVAMPQHVTSDVGGSRNHSSSSSSTASAASAAGDSPCQQLHDAAAATGELSNTSAAAAASADSISKATNVLCSSPGSSNPELKRLKPARSVPADVGSSFPPVNSAGTLLQLLKAPVAQIAAPQTSDNVQSAALRVLPTPQAVAKAVKTSRAHATLDKGAPAAAAAGRAVSRLHGAAAAAVAVECSYLGSFLFKGSPKPVEMVSFSPVVLQGRSYPTTPPSGKGMRVVQRVGVMQHAVVQLPGAVEDVWE